METTRVPTEALHKLFLANLNESRRLMCEFSSDFDAGARGLIAEAEDMGAELGMDAVVVCDLISQAGLFDLVMDAQMAEKQKPEPDPRAEKLNVLASVRFT